MTQRQPWQKRGPLAARNWKVCEQHNIKKGKNLQDLGQHLFADTIHDARNLVWLCIGIIFHHQAFVRAVKLAEATEIQPVLHFVGVCE
jgi:hypothetical protein